jgi:phosphoglucosamine mutase
VNLLKYFGTDGIRGKAYDFITPELARRVGRSLYQFKEDNQRIIVARDTRISGKMIVDEIIEGALEAGINVCDIGVYATPILAYASVKSDCFGIMITASHNPYYDNGIKIFDRGEKSTQALEEKVEFAIDNDIDLSQVKRGKMIKFPGLLDEYFDLYENFSINQNLKIGLDLANGATTTSALKVLPKFVSSYQVIGCQPDGLNINKECGSTHLDKLRELVLNNNLDLGIAFDGDGDRVLVVDKDGEIIDGDMLIFIFAKYLKDINKLNNDVVVLSKMSNIGIIKALEALNIRVIQTDVGDKYIFRALASENGVLGGENSGHIINKTLLKSGDGVLNAYFLLKVLNHYQTNLTALKKEVTYYPDKLINIKNIEKAVVNDSDIIKKVDFYRKKLGSDGKILVRASGTEPLVRVSVSAKTEELVDEIINDLVAKIKEKGKGV